jgi:hypothetical protein
MKRLSETYDQHLKTALDEYLLRQIAELPGENELAALLPLSARFDRRMGRLIRRARKQEALANQRSAAPLGSAGRRRARRRLIAVAVILALLASLMSIAAAREAVFRFVVSVYEKYSEIIFPQQTGTSASDPLPTLGENIEDIMPQELPGGYEQKSLLTTTDYVCIVYTSAVGQDVIFERITSEALRILIDTEGTKSEYVHINGREAIFHSKNQLQSIIWQDGRYAYIISGSISKEALVGIIESLYK